MRPPEVEASLETIEDQKRYAQEIIQLIGTQAVTSMATAHATEVACLKQKLDVADDDITLINRRLDEAQGMFWGGQYMYV